ncbi:MAG TPA: tetratricopeptide repeat protein, partial [Woeseiaceae bacterium]|nr:tetratricopeptide repeat protein [Woeseiaceae bacterium]
LVRAIMARGELLVVRYQYPAATEQFRRAVTLEPENYFAWDLLCWSLAYETPPKGAEAENACRTGLRIAPQYGEFYYHLARALVVQGKFDEARQAISDLRSIWPDADLPNLGLFWIYLGEKNYSEALALLAGQSQTPLILAASAAVHSGSGNTDAAIELLDEALGKGFRDIAWLEASEHFANVRALPAYRGLLVKHGLAD